MLCLYLIGFSWHLYVHNGFEELSLEADCSSKSFISEGTCPACEWLANHHFAFSSFYQEQFFNLDFPIFRQKATGVIYYSQVYQNTNSRAPPAFSITPIRLLK